MAGYYQCCNCCGREFNNAPGAYAYLQHLSESTYYGIRMSPETTWGLSGRAREFLGTTGLLKLGFQLKSQHKATIPVVLWVHHGTGNGQTGYYPLTRLEKKSAEWEQVDVFAMGHTTKMVHEFQNKVYPRWSPAQDLAHRKVILIGTGGYSKAYVLGAMRGRIPRGGYAEQRMLNAAIIGSPTLHIRPRVREGYLSVDITAEG